MQQDMLNPAWAAEVIITSFQQNTLQKLSDPPATEQRYLKIEKALKDPFRPAKDCK
jgi:hypothetical protein